MCGLVYVFIYDVCLSGFIDSATNALSPLWEPASTPGARDVVLNKAERAQPLGVIGSFKYINEDVLLNAWLGSMIMLGYGPARVGL